METGCVSSTLARSLRSRVGSVLIDRVFMRLEFRQRYGSGFTITQTELELHSHFLSAVNCTLQTEIDLPSPTITM